MAGPSSFWRFVYDKYRNRKTGKLNVAVMKKNMFEEYEASTGDTLKTNTRNFYLENIHSTDLSDSEKIELIHATDIPVDEEYLDELEDKITLELDKDGRILSYEWKPVSVEKKIVPKNAPKKEKQKRERRGRPQKLEMFQLTPTDDSLIWAFVLEKIRDDDGNVQKFKENKYTWKKFVTENELEEPQSLYKHRFHNLLIKKIAETKFGVPTKVDLHYALDAPVSEEMEKIMRKTFTIELDSKRCITKYARKDSITSSSEFMKEEDVPVDDTVSISEPTSTDRPQTHDSSPSNFSDEEDSRLWAYVLDLIRDSNTGEPRKLSDVRGKWTGLKKIFPNGKSFHFYKNRFNNILSLKIGETDFDDATKLLLYWSVGVPIEKVFLTSMRRKYDITIDNQRRVLVYSEKGDREERTEDEDEMSQDLTEDDWRSKRCLFTAKEDSDMWNFIRKKTRDPKTGKVRKYNVTEETWKEYRKNVEKPKVSISYFTRFSSKLANQLHTLKLNSHTILEMYWSLDIPIEENFLKKITKNYLLKLTNTDTVEYFSRKTPENSDPAEITGKEIWEFMIQKSRNVNGTIIPGSLKLKEIEFWQQFQLQYQLYESPAELRSHYEEELLPNLAEIKMDVKTKLPIYYLLQIPIDPKFLKKARQCAYVKCMQNIVEKYRFFKEEIVSDDNEEEKASSSGPTSEIHWEGKEEEEGPSSPKKPKIVDVDEKEVGINTKKYLEALKEFLNALDSPQLFDYKVMVQDVIDRVDEKKYVPIDIVRKILKNATGMQ